MKALALCGSVVLIGLAPLPVLAEVQRLPRSAPQSVHHASASSHLYVADPGNHEILRYSFTGGLANKTPDGVFASLGDMAYPVFLGVDGAGNIYAASTSANYRQGYVREFAPNGALLRSVVLSTAVGAFAVDAAGYMYAVPSETYIAVYAPRHRETAVLLPDAELGVGSGFRFNYLAIDADGRLYSESTETAEVFDRPRVSGGPNAVMAGPAFKYLGCPAWYGGAMAFDEHGRFYTSVDWQCYCLHCKQNQQWRMTDFDTISNGWSRSERTDRLIEGRDCRLHFSGLWEGLVTGMAVSGGYIDAACSGDRTQVYVYKADAFGRQPAVETLNGTSFPSDAKIGP